MFKVNSCLALRIGSLGLRNFAPLNTKGRLFCACIVLAVCTLACSSPPRDKLVYPKSGPILERGKDLYKGVAACGFCHGDKRSPSSLPTGGLSAYDTYGEVIASNITTAKTGIGDWSGEDIIKLLRTSKNPDEELVSYEVHNGYEWMSDNDLIAIVSYLKSIPPVDNEIERREIGTLSRNTTGFFTSPKEVVGYVPEIDKANKFEFGRYLVDRVARCGYCHNSPDSLLVNGEYLAGGKVVRNEKGEKVAPSILPSGGINSGEWGRKEWAIFFKKGVAPDGKRIDGDFCPVNFYRTANDEDLEAMIEYLGKLS